MSAVRDWRRASVAGPLGEMLVVSDASGALCALDFADCRARLARLLAGYYGIDLDALPPAAPEAAVAGALAAYFDGRCAALDALAPRLPGTPFQRSVWQALRAIPRGETRSYGALAASLGRPRAARAVGAANGANPLALVVPCHRLIGAGGALTGYAGGLARKRWLLEHEGVR